MILGFRFDVRCWIFEVWYNRKLKHSWHNKREVSFLCILIFEWTIWLIKLLDFLVPRLDFSSGLYSYQKTIWTNIRIYLYQKNDTNEYPNIFVSKNNTNEYPNIFASKKWYEYDTNEYSYRKIFECTNTFVLNFWYQF